MMDAVNSAPALMLLDSLSQLCYSLLMSYMLVLLITQSDLYFLTSNLCSPLKTYTSSRMRAGYYVHPGSHAGSPSADSPAPIYGCRLRLKDSYDISSLGDAAQIVATALKKYGMLLSDGGKCVVFGYLTVR